MMISGAAIIIVLIIISLVAGGIDTIRPIGCDLCKMGRVLTRYLEGLEQLSNLCLHGKVLTLKVDQLGLSIGVNLLKELSKVVDVINKGLLVSLELVHAVLKLSI